MSPTIEVLRRGHEPTTAKSTEGRPGRRLLFCSWCAFYPPLWAVVERLVSDHNFSVTVIAPPRAAVGNVKSLTGNLVPELVSARAGDTRLVPLRSTASPTNGFLKSELKAALSGLSPDAIWIHGEPTDELTRQILKHFFFRRKATFACYVAENIYRKPTLIQQFKTKVLSARIDALLGCASLSTEAIREVFVPRGVRSYTTFLPHFDPLESPYGSFSVNKEPADFWIGFVGRICPEKGWRVLLDALLELPMNAKVVIAGDGPDAALLQQQICSPELRNRVIFAGLLSAEDVRALYRQVDTVVVPSLTTATWKEQFGRVIAEAMAAGLPVVGSESGAIPEAIGTAGIVVREGDPQELANALRCLMTNPYLRQKLSEAGRRRFETEFSIDAYASRLAGILAAG